MSVQAMNAGAVDVTLALLGVVKDNPESVAHTAANAAHTMPKVDAIFAARSFDWAIVDGECYRVTLS
jgi:hypothetical protein